MKDNTGSSKDLLIKVLRHLPQDFALREVRHHISLALRKLEHVEKKRAIRDSQESQAEPATPNLPYYPPDALGIIDQMIESESKKLDELKATKEKKKNHVNDSDETILG